MEDNRLGSDSAKRHRALAWQSRLFISRQVFSPSSMPIRRSDRPCSPSWSAMLSWQPRLVSRSGPIRSLPVRSSRLLGLVADEAERWQLQQSWREQSEFVMRYVRLLTH